MTTKLVCRDWLNWAIGEIESDISRSADTHLVRLPFCEYPGVDIYFKDESTHPSGSLKHRLARSLFLYALCNGWINKDTSIIEASSGSTAISEAYFAQLLELRFIAVVPRGTAPAKLNEIERLNGEVHFVDSGDIYTTAESLAQSLNGHYMDQFTYAERATDWRGNNNIAESIFSQMAHERYPVPRWIVVGAGTGGTSATIGRYIRYRRASCCGTQLAVVDPDYSVFAESHRTGRRDLVSDRSGQIEGIGRPRVEPSFIPNVIDRMIEVPDAASFLATRVLSERLGRRVGPSTGTNFVGVRTLAREMVAAGETGSIVTLICDSGERYLGTAFCDEWMASHYPEPSCEI
jgi:cysteine synthase